MAFKSMNKNQQEHGSKLFSKQKSLLPQISNLFMALLLSLLLFAGCASSPSSNQNGQNIGTPLPTIAARNPGYEQPFCTDRQNQTAWSGPNNVRQVDSAVPPPVTPGLIGGYSVGDFNAPCIMPKVGVVRIEIFISDKMVGPVFGEGRGSDPLFDPADTKVAIILDFAKGEAQIVAAPTCHGAFQEPRLKEPVIAKPACAHAYPLSGIRGNGHNWFRWKIDPNQPGFPNGTEFLSFQYEFSNPTFRGLPLVGSSAQILNPAINGLIHFAFEPETGDVCLKGTIDDFPVVAIHQVHYDADGKVSTTIKPITLARHKESEPPLIGLTDPFHWTEAHIGNQCGQSLTGEQVTKFLIPTPNITAYNITAGPDGNLWFTEFTNRIGRITPSGTITEFTIPADSNTNITGITTGPDGNLWFTEDLAGQIGRITPSGTITQFAILTLGSLPNGIATGPDGNLWFTETDAHQIGRITPSGIITEFAIPTRFTSQPFEIATGPDGNLWFTEQGTNQIGRITPSGIVTEFEIPQFVDPASASVPQGITTGPDGNLWFTEEGGNQIGRITPNGTITEFAIPTSDSLPMEIITGPDGNLWFTEEHGNHIGRITPNGTITEFATPIPGNENWEHGITIRKDGAICFTAVNQIGCITTGK